MPRGSCLLDVGVARAAWPLPHHLRVCGEVYLTFPHAQGGYMNADKDNKEIGMPRGEILIGGPGVCDGYLVDPTAPDPDVVAKNRDEFVTIDGQRYFCTGDVGQYTPEGNLMIIDRKKDLVKLQQGEYVALSKVENVLKTSQYTALPMVYALSSMSYCIALICPNEGPLMKLAASLGVSGDLGAVCEDAKVVAAVLKDITAECKKGKLAKFEIPTKVILVAELWTPENELLTAVSARPPGGGLPRRPGLPEGTGGANRCASSSGARSSRATRRRSTSATSRRPRPGRAARTKVGVFIWHAGSFPSCLGRSGDPPSSAWAAAAACGSVPGAPSVPAGY